MREVEHPRPSNIDTLSFSDLSVHTIYKSNIRKSVRSLRIDMDADRHASRPARLDSRVKSPSTGPPQLSPVDRIISLHHGSTTAIEATPERLQATKQYPKATLPERIEELQRQNSSLTHEVAYYREMEQYRQEFEHDMVRLKERFEKALFKLGRRQQEVGEGWTRLRTEDNAQVQNGLNSPCGYNGSA